MGDSDAFYFKQLFSNQHHNKTFVIYGYGKKALDSLKENIQKYTRGLNVYKAKTNNDIVFIDCSDYNKQKALAETKEVIDKVMYNRKQQTQK